MTQLLQSSGFQAQLRGYITELFRTGQATTAHEAYTLAMNRIKECMREGVATNGHSSGDEEGGGDLRVPESVVREGSKVVRRELERVVDIDMD